MTPCRWMRRLFGIALLLSPSAQAGPEEDALAVWRLLDYVAVDYREAVAGGQIVNRDEYAEMIEFSVGIEARLRALPPAPGQASLVEQAAALSAAIQAKQDAAQVAASANGLAQALIAAYPVPTAPGTAPDVTRAAPLYQQHCAGCHGATGRGDGPLAAGMEPPPIDFHDRERHAGRSVFALYGIISNGVDGTAMTAFPQLDEAQRWALAFYVGQMPYSEEDRERGKTAWRVNPAARAAVPSLAALVAATPGGLAESLGEEEAAAITAYLRADPQAALPPAGDSLALAAQLVRQSTAAAGAGDRTRAVDLALSAYLDGFEPVEPALAARDAELMRRIEGALLEYRAALQRGDDATAIAADARALESLLADAQAALEGDISAAGAFAASFVILFREGLEAALVLVAIVAGLRRTGRLDAMPYVHAGWLAAVLLGVATWVAATWIINISGAQREATEGVTGLIAVAILIVVGLWLHSQALSGRWQAYVNQAIRTQLSRNRLWGLGALAFVAVYREAFEIVLFYRALWEQGAHDSVLLGMGVAALALIAVGWALFRASSKLPLRQFFLASSVFIAVLAVVMAGHAAAALQEAGWVGVTPWPLPTVEWLGIRPTAEGIGSQVLVAVLVLAGLWLNRRRAGDGSGAA